jgi:hypothetical protein
MEETIVQPRPISEHPPLCDEQGPIPTFPPLTLDERGRIIPLSPEERQARSDAIQRLLKVLREQPADTEKPDTFEEFMRSMDSRRPEGMKLFEGYY